MWPEKKSACLCVYETEKTSVSLRALAIIYFEWENRSMIKGESFSETYPKCK
jgi:hypothetical protein